MTVRRICYYLLCAFVFTLPWQNAISIGGSRTVSTFLGASVLFLTATVVLAEWKIARPSPLLFAMLLFAAWEVATVAWSIDTGLTIRRAMTLLQLLGMVWLVGELGQSEGERRAFMQAFVLGCFVVTFATVQSWGSGAPMEGFRYAPKQFSLNETADTLAVGIVMALILITHSRNKLLYWLDVAYIPLAVLSVVITGSRSGFIATCIALLGIPLVLKASRHVYRVAWAVVIMASFALLFFASPDNHTLEQNLRRITFSEDTASLDTMTGRTVIWSAGYSVFREHPAGGIGAGTFSRGVGPRLDRARAPHNLFVSVAVETGTIGVVLVSAVLASALVPAVRAKGSTRGLHLLLFAVLVAMAFVANVDTSKVLWFGLALLSLAGRSGSALRTAAPAVVPEPAPPSLRAVGPAPYLR